MRQLWEGVDPARVWRVLEVSGGDRPPSCQAAPDGYVVVRGVAGVWRPLTVDGAPAMCRWLYRVTR